MKMKYRSLIVNKIFSIVFPVLEIKKKKTLFKCKWSISQNRNLSFNYLSKIGEKKPFFFFGFSKLIVHRTFEEREKKKLEKKTHEKGSKIKFQY